MRPQHSWTKAQIDFVRKTYRRFSEIETHARYNRHFKIKRPLGSIAACINNRRLRCGRTGNFEKGHIPWNYGTKGMGISPGYKPTCFKKGSVPPNRKPIGTERINVDGYVEIKVKRRDPHTGFPTRYMSKHVYLYEKWHGKVPKNTPIIFRDGNRRNFSKKNLVMVSRGQLAGLNQDGYGKCPARLKPAMFAKIMLKNKIFTVIKNQRLPKWRPALERAK